MRLGLDERAIQLYEQSLIQWKETANTPEEARTAVLLAGLDLAKAQKNDDFTKAFETLLAELNK